MRQYPGPGAELVLDAGGVQGIGARLVVDIGQHVLIVEMIVDLALDGRQVVGIGLGRHAEHGLAVVETGGGEIVGKAVDEPQRRAVAVIGHQEMPGIGFLDIDLALVLRLAFQRRLGLGAVIHVDAIGLDAVFAAFVEADGVLRLGGIGDGQALAVGDIVEFQLGPGGVRRVVLAGDVAQQAVEAFQAGNQRLGVGRRRVAIDDEVRAFAANPGVGVVRRPPLLSLDDHRRRLVATCLLGSRLLRLREGRAAGDQKNGDRGC